MPANQFSALAWLAPVAIIFWLGASIFFSLFDLFALVWWQQALVFLVFYRVWCALVERCARLRRVRRTDPRGDLPPSRAPVQSREPRPGLAYARLVCTVAFGLALFYPSWWVRLLGLLALFVVVLGLGLRERRLAVDSGEPRTPINATPALRAGGRQS